MNVKSFKHVKESNKIEVIFIETCGSLCLCNKQTSTPNKEWKEVYSVEDGVIQRTQTINK